MGKAICHGVISPQRQNLCVPTQFVSTRPIRLERVHHVGSSLGCSVPVCRILPVRAVQYILRVYFSWHNNNNHSMYTTSTLKYKVDINFGPDQSGLAWNREKAGCEENET